MSAEVEQRFFVSKVFLASWVKRRDLLATATVKSDVQEKMFIQVIVKENLRIAVSLLVVEVGYKGLGQRIYGLRQWWLRVSKSFGPASASKFLQKDWIQGLNKSHKDKSKKVSISWTRGCVESLPSRQLGGVFLITDGGTCLGSMIDLLDKRLIKFDIASRLRHKKGRQYIIKRMIGTKEKRLHGLKTWLLRVELRVRGSKRKQQESLQVVSSWILMLRGNLFKKHWSWAGEA